MTDFTKPPNVHPLRPGQPIPMPGPGQQVQFQVDLKNATQRLCAACGCEFFQEVFEMYVVSALANPTGQALPVKKPVLICLECRAVLE